MKSIDLIGNRRTQFYLAPSNGSQIYNIEQNYPQYAIGIVVFLIVIGWCALLYCRLSREPSHRDNLNVQHYSILHLQNAHNHQSPQITSAATSYESLMGEIDLPISYEAANNQSLQIYNTSSDDESLMGEADLPPSYEEVMDLDGSYNLEENITIMFNTQNNRPTNIE